MTKFLLKISAELHNISTMIPNGGVDSADMPYFIKLQCENCGEVTGEQCIYMSEAVYHNGDEFNHAVKCRGCKRVGTVDLIPGHGDEFTAMHSARGAFAPLMLFECDGLVPVNYFFNGRWMITVTDPKKVIKVNLVNGGFEGSKEEYGNKQPIVKELKAKFEVQS